MSISERFRPGFLQEKPHGTRLRYLGGCRCLPCRAANARHSSECEARRRRGEGNPIVSADAVRAHLRKLSRLGVGYKSAADAASVPRSIVNQVLRNPTRGIRAQSAKRLLAVDASARADKALIPAAPTWKRVEKLLEEGFTRQRIARELGSKAKVPSIQFRGHGTITARTASRVERLCARYEVS